MPANYRHNMTETITYWPPGGNDAFGTPTLGAPVAVAARWQDQADLFRDADGREVTSAAVVYVDQPVSVRGQLFRGESVAATPPEGSLEIRQVAITRSLRGGRQLTKAML